MTDTWNTLQSMLLNVATALGDDLLPRVAFVGGCTTGLLLTDSTSRDDVRFTDDVDLIIGLTGVAEWVKLQESLGRKGFRVAMGEDVACRTRLGDLIVDFMPDNASILGFTNRWYRDALSHTLSTQLSDSVSIRYLSAPYFLGTKFEAFAGRGKNDVLESRDIEDILLLMDGREEVVSEVHQSESRLRHYLRDAIHNLIEHPDFHHALPGSIRDAGRAELALERMQAIVAGKTQIY
jgi:hypothetical protein